MVFFDTLGNKEFVRLEQLAITRCYVRDGEAEASEHALKVKQTISEAGPLALRGLSRVAYSSSYWVAYGVVYAVVFVVRSLPQENPPMHGFRDGGRAAMDALKSE